MKFVNMLISISMTTENIQQRLQTRKKNIFNFFFKFSVLEVRKSDRFTSQNSKIVLH